MSLLVDKTSPLHVRQVATFQGFVTGTKARHYYHAEISKLMPFHEGRFAAILYESNGEEAWVEADRLTFSMNDENGRYPDEGSALDAAKYFFYRFGDALLKADDGYDLVEDESFGDKEFQDWREAHDRHAERIKVRRAAKGKSKEDQYNALFDGLGESW